jgi:hypothetical protein
MSLKEHSMLIFNKRRTMSKRRATRRRPCLEALEGRVVLSTFTVNTFNDTVALKPSAGPFDKNHDISLRSAIMAADAHPAAADTIILPGGTYTLMIPPPTGTGAPTAISTFRPISQLTAAPRRKLSSTATAWIGCSMS